ncbi:hypothetical protein ACFLY7_02590 [Patescibacteria group bacterium]
MLDSFTLTGIDSMEKLEVLIDENKNLQCGNGILLPPGGFSYLTEKNFEEIKSFLASKRYLLEKREVSNEFILRKR